MNYRHIYHAGNICDVVKHSVLALLLAAMKNKDKGFAFLDTHAGCGLYDLQDPRAQKTKESEQGAAKLWRFFSENAQDPGLLSPYLAVLRGLNEGRELLFYPGSPWFAHAMLREQDRLIACELQAEDHQALRQLLGLSKAAQIHRRDGYETLRALLPFPETRGLILIDPPFEMQDEFDKLLAAIKLIHSRMPQVATMMWYPIKDEKAISGFHLALRMAHAQHLCPPALLARFFFREGAADDELVGSGLVLFNPPWTLQGQLRTLFETLHQILQTNLTKNKSFIAAL
ncbi:MAG: 23S rRNA (adenine(2030)-N(6))-methyltransferase RlmJ [Alphaproteobacteria bacterium]|nr:23S rRNA (adenine(2030)-N(6))-methyltransferase RlmJ [Alphaproteobacteria bacterium]